MDAAASVYFHDPDGNLLEYIAMLDESSDPHANVMSWINWLNRRLRSTEIGTTARLSSEALDRYRGCDGVPPILS